MYYIHVWWKRELVLVCFMHTVEYLFLKTTTLGRPGYVARSLIPIGSCHAISTMALFVLWYINGSQQILAKSTMASQEMAHIHTFCLKSPLPKSYVLLLLTICRLTRIILNRYFLICVRDWFWKHRLWNCSEVHITEPHEWLVNTGPCSGLVLSAIA